MPLQSSFGLSNSDFAGRNSRLLSHGPSRRCMSPPPPAMAESGPFAEFAGSWSGSGTLRPENGASERIRCNASYRPGGRNQQELNCSSAAPVTVTISISPGSSARTNKTRSAAAGLSAAAAPGARPSAMAQGDRLQLHIESAGFAADVVMVTRNRRQSVNIDSHGAGQIVKATITLNRS